MTERAFCSSRNDKVCGFGGAETANLSNARHRHRFHRGHFSTTAKRNNLDFCAGAKKERVRIECDARYQSMSRAIYPYRFDFDLNKGEVKRRRRNTHDTRIRSGSGEIHYHIRRRRKSRRGDDGINSSTRPIVSVHSAKNSAVADFHLFIS